MDKVPNHIFINMVQKIIREIVFLGLLNTTKSSLLLLIKQTRHLDLLNLFSPLIFQNVSLVSIKFITSTPILTPLHYFSPKGRRKCLFKRVFYD
jgi:hypothetical protein